MKRSMGYLLVLATLCLLLPAAARAESFDPEQVSSEARWVVHLNVKGALESRMGKFFLGMIEEEDEMVELHAFGTKVDFDPFEDLHSITAYGKGYDEKVVALIKGRFNKKKILQLLREEGCEFDEQEYEDYEVYQFEDGGDRFYLCTYRKDLAVFSNSRKMLRDALDVLMGEKESLADGGKLKGMGGLPDGTYMAAAARGFAELGEHDPEAAVLAKAERIMVAAGESEGEVFVKGTLVTQDEKTAAQIRDIVRGIIALGSMVGDEEPELAELARFAQSLDISASGRKLTLHESMPSEELIKLFKKYMD